MKKTTATTVLPPLAPSLLDEGGGGLPEGAVVTVARPAGKGRAPDPGGPPIPGI